jgi:predicted AlkP superfamily pyrophosphatase or phosphodiesterase
MTTAAISWPVTVGLQADFVQPEFWRTGSRHASDRWLMRAISTRDLLDEVERANGQPLPWPLTDRSRADIAAYLLRTHRPRVLLLHLLALDGAQHADGPDSPRARRVLGEMDGLVKQVRNAVQEAGLADRTYIAIVSDHGFLPIEQQLQVNALFRQEGLLKVSDRGVPTEWQAYFQASGGSGFVYLKDAADTQMRERVRVLLEKLRGDPQYGVASVWTREDLARFGAHPDAAFGIGMRSGFYTGSGTETLLMPTRNRGGHGFDPNLPALHASLILTGGAFRGRGSLGIVRMTQIGPTLANLLGLELSAGSDQPIPAAAATVAPSKAQAPPEQE